MCYPRFYKKTTKTPKTQKQATNHVKWIHTMFAMTTSLSFDTSLTPDWSVLYFFNEWVPKPRVERTNFLARIASLLTFFLLITIILMLVILYYIFFQNNVITHFNWIDPCIRWGVLWWVGGDWAWWVRCEWGRGLNDMIVSNTTKSIIFNYANLFFNFASFSAHQGVILSCHRIRYVTNIDSKKLLCDGVLQNVGLHVSHLCHL